MLQLKEIDGRYYQNCKIVILPTKKVDKGQIFIYKKDKKCPINEEITKKGTVGYAAFPLNESEYYQPQHLYITSDEEIKEGDWCVLDLGENTRIVQVKSLNSGHSIFTVDIIDGYAQLSNLTKIIATTDTSIIIGEIWDNLKKTVNKFVELGKLPKSNKQLNLPQPSQQFIEKYIEGQNKSNVITDGLVEVINLKNTYITQEDLDSLNCTDFSKVSSKYGFKYVEDFFDAMNKTLFLIDGYKVYNIKTVQLHDIYQDYFKGDFLFEITEFEKDYQLKLDSQNQITIRQQKDSWNREELPLDSLITLRNALNTPIYKRKFGENSIINEAIKELDNWIEANL